MNLLKPAKTAEQMTAWVIRAPHVAKTGSTHFCIVFHEALTLLKQNSLVSSDHFPSFAVWMVELPQQSIMSHTGAQLGSDLVNI